MVTQLDHLTDSRWQLSGWLSNQPNMCSDQIGSMKKGVRATWLDFYSNAIKSHPVPHKQAQVNQYKHVVFFFRNPKTGKESRFLKSFKGVLLRVASHVIQSDIILFTTNATLLCSVTRCWWCFSSLASSTFTVQSTSPWVKWASQKKKKIEEWLSTTSFFSLFGEIGRLQDGLTRITVPFPLNSLSRVHLSCSNGGFHFAEGQLSPVERIQKKKKKKGPPYKCTKAKEWSMPKKTN